VDSQQIAQIDSTAPAEIETLTQTVNSLADRPRFETALLGFFALCGLLMAVIGLYGVIAFMAAQRTQEIGVPMALGATRMDILRLIAGEGVRLIVLVELSGWSGAGSRTVAEEPAVPCGYARSCQFHCRYVAACLVALQRHSFQRARR